VKHVKIGLGQVFQIEFWIISSCTNQRERVVVHLEPKSCINITLANMDSQDSTWFKLGKRRCPPPCSIICNFLPHLHQTGKNIEVPNWGFHFVPKYDYKMFRILYLPQIWSKFDSIRTYNINSLNVFPLS
jgi:hypothetical protein